MGVGAVWYRIGSELLAKGQRSCESENSSCFLSFLQPAHNAHQLAMAMFWDVAREPGAYECLQTQRIFGQDWNQFMNQYLSLAADLQRHESSGLPQAKETYGLRVPELKIGIASVCAYNETSKLHGIDEISLKNREQYVAKHGYRNVFETDNVAAPKHPVWSAFALPLKMLESGEFDYVMWMDCDALFIDQTRTIEDLMFIAEPELASEPGNSKADLFISEDGRGLSGGNWIIRNSPWSIQLLKTLLHNPEYDEWDLRDQFSLLWTLLRPSVSKTVQDVERTWGGLGYPDNVRLIPQRLLNAYPWSLCRPSHHCFEDEKDFIVSFITLSSLSREMGFTLLDSFASRND